MVSSTEPLYRRYFEWLYSQAFLYRDIDSGEVTSHLSYIHVADRMHNIWFKPLVEYDDNRIADGSELRQEFLLLHGGRRKNALASVSILEVLLGLARRANIMIDVSEHEWFSIFLANLNLDKFNDEYCLSHATGRVDRILNRFNDRRYDYNGNGGIFPLRRTKHDQRQVELWYQMGEYMTENNMY